MGMRVSNKILGFGVATRIWILLPRPFRPVVPRQDGLEPESERAANASRILPHQSLKCGEEDGLSPLQSKSDVPKSERKIDYLAKAGPTRQRVDFPPLRST